MTVRDNIAAVKTAVKMVDLLKFHGIVVPADTQTQLSCPFHGADAHPSARVYSDTNSLFCWTCHKVWDVISAEMEFTGLPLVEAVQELVVRFKVAVEEQPQEIAKFYATVNRYVYGDKKQAQLTASDLADKFRRYYMDLSEWRLLSHVIEYFWEEFDNLAAETPVEGLDKVFEWYANAHAAVSGQLEAVSTINPVIVAEVPDQLEEFDG